jgi:16S rRNA processing protein RimM
MKETIVVGKVSSSHGLKGEVMLFPLTDDIERFLNLEYLLFDGIEHAVEEARLHKGQALLKLEGIETRDAADRMRGKLAQVRREDAVELGEGEYFIEDLKGIRVLDRRSDASGVLKDVLQTGGVDILVIEVGGKEKMMPFLKADAGNVDLERGFMEADFGKLVE